MGVFFVPLQQEPYWKLEESILLGYYKICKFEDCPNTEIKVFNDGTVYLTSHGGLVSWPRSFSTKLSDVQLQELKQVIELKEFSKFRTSLFAKYIRPINNRDLFWPPSTGHYAIIENGKPILIEEQKIFSDIIKQTNTKANEHMRKITSAECQKDIDCPQGHKCYNSQFTPEGVRPEQKGDLRCHKICSSSVECTTPHITCKEVEIWTGSVVEMYRMCL